MDRKTFDRQIISAIKGSLATKLRLAAGMLTVHRSGTQFIGFVSFLESIPRI